MDFLIRLGPKGENIRNYSITLQSPSGKELDSDQSNSSEYSMFMGDSGLIVKDDIDIVPDLNVGEKDSVLTFAYSAGKDFYYESNYKDYFENASGVDITVNAKDSEGSAVSSFSYHTNTIPETNGTTDIPVNDLEVSEGNVKSEDITNENTFINDNNERCYMFEVPEGSEGTFVFKLLDSFGDGISNSDGIFLRDGAGNIIEIRPNYANPSLLAAQLSSGLYYLVLPDNVSMVKIENLGNKANLDNYESVTSLISSADESNIIADFFEKVLFWFVMAMGKILQMLISIIVGENLSIDKLIFDDYAYTSLSFFRNDVGTLIDNPYLTGAIDPLNFLFNLFTNISLVAYMIILVYMGIRVLLVSTADKKAKYKQIIADWVKGIAIIFLFPYVIKYTILVNHAFVKYIQSKIGNDLSGYSAVIPNSSGSLGSVDIDIDKLTEEAAGGSSGNYMTDMYNKALDSKRLAYALCWLIMLVQVIQFLIVYIKRLITIMFLIVIFPLVAISYAIDKIGDGKSQAFNHWCKEFVLQVFVQSFHAMNYVLVMGIVFKLLNLKGIVNWFLVIVGITYVSKGGDILRGLFAQMGGGGAGGPMSVAGTLLKTQATISAIRGLKSTASRIVGPQSMLGKGINQLNTSYDKHLAGMTAQRQEEARNAIAKNRESQAQWDKRMARFRGEDAAKKLASEGETMPAIEFVNNIKQLNKLDKEDLDFVLGQLGEEDRRIIGELLTHATAAQIVKNPKGATNFEIHTQVDILINDKTRGGNPLIDRFDNKIPSYNTVPDLNELRKMRAASSIHVDSEYMSNRKTSNVSLPTDKTDRLKTSLHRIQYAFEGKNSLEEIQDAVDAVDEALNSGTEEHREMIRQAETNMGYSMEDFKTNLAVQTLNSFKGADISRTNEEQAKIDKSIRQVKKANRDESNKLILNNLDADVNKLREGYLPEYIDRAKESEAKIKEEIAQNPYSVDMGDEYTQYLHDKAAELRSEARRDAIFGTIRAAAGSVAAITKIGVGTATAGTLVGSTVDTSKKDNIIEQVALSAPAGFNMGSNTVSKVGQIGSTVVGAASDTVDTIRTIAGIPAQEKENIDFETNRKSIELNKQYYEQQAATREAQRREAGAEAEREKLLKKIREASNDKK